MFKYLDLCVDLKKSHVAKEGLFQYRNMCQVTNVASLAAVVQGYLNMAEKRTDEAKQESVESVQEVDDLENLATPEVIMLSAVSGEDAQDRSVLPDSKSRSLPFLGLRQGGGPWAWGVGRNPRKGRDLILQRSAAEP